MLMEPKRRADGVGGGLVAVAVAALAVVCCAGPALLAGVLGGIALGGFLGVGAGVAAIVGLVAVVVVTRRRRALACRVERDRTLPS